MIKNNQKVADNTSPLAVFLVKSGSKGDRLLFRYPFAYEDTRDFHCRKKHKSPYALTVSEDPLNSPRTVSGTTEINDNKLTGFSDKVLSNLFAVKPDLCGQKFELKVNDVRFVGHPTQLSSPTMRDTSSIFMFNIVFALKADANYDVVKCYHDFTYRLSIALKHEEKRCSYLSSQARLMISIHDEVATQPESEAESPYKWILERSRLASDLKTAFDDLTSSGVVHLEIQKWIEVSFCLPHKVHRIHSNNFSIGPDAVQACLQALRPYHGLLLLVEQKELIESLPQDASPALVRLIQIIKPLKSLQTLSADADLTLTQVFQLAGHLIYWAKATVIYPLCETNVYYISHIASTSVNSPLVDVFSDKFPGYNLLGVLSEFSLPISLSNLTRPHCPVHMPQEQVTQIRMIVWMLQHRLLVQLHTYVYLVTTAEPCSLFGETDHSPDLETTEDVTSAASVTSTVLQATEETNEETTTSYQSELGSSVSSEEFLPGNIDAPERMLETVTSVSETPESVASEIKSSPQVMMSSILSHSLTAKERECIMKIPDALNLDDLRLFARLAVYFKGQHHLEEIMYRENLRRSQLWTLLDKFRDVLIKCQHEDAAVAAFYKYRN